MSSANLVRLLTWLLSTADNPCAVPACSVGEVLAATMQLWMEFPPDDITPGCPESPPTFQLAVSPLQASSTVLWAYTPLPWALPMPDIKASDTPVRLPSLTLAIGPKLKKCNCSPNSAPNGQCDKKACTGTGEGLKHIHLSMGCSPLPIQPKANN